MGRQGRIIIWRLLKTRVKNLKRIMKGMARFPVLLLNKEGDSCMGRCGVRHKRRLTFN